MGTHFLWDTRDHSEDEAVREAYCYSQARSPKDQRGSKNLPFQLWALSYLVFLPAKLLPTLFETLEYLFLDFCIHACGLSFNVWMPRNIMRLLFSVPFLIPDLLRRSVRSSSLTLSHSVSKNVTPRRMLKKCYLIAQMNRQINSFQNM